MGAGASIETNGHIYNAMMCGCIYRCEYQECIANGNVALVKCCYHCLEKLKRRTFDYRMVDSMCKNTRGESINILTDKLGWTPEDKTGWTPEDKTGWMTEVSALAYADKHGIRSVEEFIYNTNILNKYGFGR